MIPNTLKYTPFDTGKCDAYTELSMIDIKAMIAKIPTITLFDPKDNVRSVPQNQYKIIRTSSQELPKFSTGGIKYDSMPTHNDNVNCEHVETNTLKCVQDVSSKGDNTGNTKHKLIKSNIQNAKNRISTKCTHDVRQSQPLVRRVPNKNNILKESNCDENRAIIHDSPIMVNVCIDHVTHMAQNHDITTAKNDTNITVIKNEYTVNRHSPNIALALMKPTINDAHPILRKHKQLSDLRTAKTSLNKILIGKNVVINQRIIFDAVTRTHQLIVHLYMFLRLFILDKYHRNQDIPHINRDFMSMAIKSLVLPCFGGPTPKGNNLKMLQEFEEFYETNYKHLGYDVKISGSNLSHVLAYMETDIITNIENNIKMHFTKYVNQFANSFFKPQFKLLVEKTDKKNKVALKKQLDRELYEIKQDLINHTLMSDSKYHEWIKKHRPHMFPAKIINSHEFDISADPQKYLKHMIYMCIEIEKTGGKSFQFFTIRSNMVPKYIPIDTATLIDLFVPKDKNKYFGNIDACKKDLWKRIMNTSDSVFEQKHYVFDHRILTDGFAVSIQLINICAIEKSQQKKGNMKNARNATRELYAELSDNEIEVLKQKSEKKKRDEKIQNRLNRKLESDKKRDAFKQLPKKEQRD